MRAFDLLSNAEQEIRTASHPRYQFEMLLLKWMHTRKLVPLTDLLASGGGSADRLQAPRSKLQPPGKLSTVVAPPPKTATPATAAPATTPDSRFPHPGNLKDRLLAEIRSGKATFYNTVVAQAQRIDVTGEHITFVFGPAQSTLRGWFDQQKPWLEAAAERIAGRKMAVITAQGEAVNPANPANVEPGTPNPEPRTPNREVPPSRDLKAEAMSSSTVQAMLDVFPAEIRDVEETP
jgi:DNA polymerase III gamma/tau subunit